MSVGEFLGEKAFCCFLPPHYSPVAAAAVPETQPQSIAANPHQSSYKQMREWKNKKIPKPTLETHRIADPGSGEGVLINY